MKLSFLGGLKRRYLLLSCLGAVVIGVTLPCLLVCWNTWPAGPFANVAHLQPHSPFGFIDECAQLLAIALIACSPGAIILAALLHHVLVQMQFPPDAKPILRGILAGMLVAFLNFPGYAAGALMKGPATNLRLGCLFAIAGATCGAWISWQAYRASHPEAGIFPRYSLRTLIIIALLWGVLLAIYAPAVAKI